MVIRKGLVSVLFLHGPRVTSLDIAGGIVYKFIVGSNRGLEVIVSYQLTAAGLSSSVVI